MSLMLAVPDEIAIVVEEIAARSGRTPEYLLLEALSAHFPPIPAALKAEFDALELASDEDLLNFELNEEKADAAG